MFGALLLLRQVFPALETAGSLLFLAVGVAFLVSWVVNRGLGSLYLGAIITALAAPDLLAAAGVISGPGVGTLCLGIAFLFIALVRGMSGAGWGWQLVLGAILFAIGARASRMPNVSDIVWPVTPGRAGRDRARRGRCRPAASPRRQGLQNPIEPGASTPRRATRRPAAPRATRPVAAAMTGSRIDDPSGAQTRWLSAYWSKYGSTWFTNSRRERDDLRRGGRPRGDVDEHERDVDARRVRTRRPCPPPSRIETRRAVAAGRVPRATAGGARVRLVRHADRRDRPPVGRPEERHDVARGQLADVARRGIDDPQRAQRATAPARSPSRRRR